MTTSRQIKVYSRVLLYGGPVLLGAVLVADRRWVSQPLEALFLVACCVGLRGAQIPLSKYSYLTQTGLVSLAGSLLVGLPATALAVAAGTLCADWAWQRKTPGAAVINAGREIVAPVVAWPPEVWGIVGVLLAFLGLLFKGMLEEAISAEELNKIHAMEAVITSNISLEDAFARIERLAHRLVDWGDFRIYRRHEGQGRLAS